jgi:hypothetical protein
MNDHARKLCFPDPRPRRTRAYDVTSVADAVVAAAVLRRFDSTRDVASPETTCEPNQVIKDAAATKAVVLVLIGDPVTTCTYLLGGL